MTMPQGATEEPDVILTERQSVPVHVVSSDAKPNRSIGTEFGRWRTFLITNQVGQDSATPGARRLLNRSLRRHRAHIIVNASVSGSTPNGGTSLANGNSVTSPAASANIASITAPPAGTYIVWVYVNLSGTVAAGTDNNNIRLQANGGTVTTLTDDIVAGQQAFGPFTIVANGTNNFNVQTIAAGTAGSVYSGTIIATPVAGSGGGGNSVTDGVIVGGREEISSGVAMVPGNVGGYLQIGDNVRWEVQQELWVAYPSTNSAPVYVSICDEVYASDPDVYPRE